MLFLLAAPLSHTVNEAVSDLSNPDVYNKDTGSSFSRAVEDTTGVKMSAIIYEEGGSLNESLAMMYDAQDQLTEAYKQAALPFVKAFAGDARAEQVSHQIDVLSERNREMTKPLTVLPPRAPCVQTLWPVTRTTARSLPTLVSSPSWLSTWLSSSPTG